MHFFLLCVYIIMVIVRPHELYPEYFFPPLQIILLAAFIVWYVSEKSQKKETQHYYLITLVIILMLSLVAEGWIGGVSLVLQEMFPVALVYFIMTGTLSTFERLQSLLKVLLFSAIFICIYSIDQSINGVGWTGAPMINGRIAYYGIFSDPNDLGLLLVFTLPLTIYFSIISRKFIKRIFYLALAGVLLYTVYLTNSRGTMLAVGLMFMYMLYRKKGVFVAGSAIAVLIPIVMLIPSRLSELDTEEESASNRFEAWYDGIHMFIAEPFLGVGYKMFTEHHHMTAHNSYVLVLAESGIFGFFFWLGMVILTFLQIRHVINTIKDTGLTTVAAEHYDPAKLMLALFLGFIAVLFGIFFLSRSYNIFIFIVLATILSAYRLAQTVGVPELQLPQRHLTVLFSTLAAIVALYLITRILL